MGLSEAHREGGSLPRVGRHLEANERVLWTGRPLRKGFVLSTWGSIPSGLVFVGITFVWLWGVPSSRIWEDFTLFGLPLVLIGLGISLGPTGWQFLKYRNTEYMITDHRLITQTGAVGLDTGFVPLDRIQEVYVRIGILDKVFGTGSLYAMTAGYSGLATADGTGGLRPSLRALKDPYQVQRLLQEAMEKSRKKQTGSFLGT